jgi:hypothetical protein
MSTEWDRGWQSPGADGGPRKQAGLPTEPQSLDSRCAHSQVSPSGKYSYQMTRSFATHWSQRSEIRLELMLDIPDACQRRTHAHSYVLCVCVCICVYVFLLFLCLSVWMCVCTCACVRVCIYVYVGFCVSVCESMYIYMCVWEQEQDTSPSYYYDSKLYMSLYFSCYALHISKINCHNLVN